MERDHAGRVALWLIVVAFGCQGVVRDDALASGDPGEPASDASTGGDGGAGAGTVGVEGSGSPVFDLPLPPAGESCQAVDLLFVVDNSGSMYVHQENLVNNFPTFIDGMRSALADVDSFHVGVVTSDAYAYNASGCDEIGGLVVSTFDQEEIQCGPYSEGNYMSEADDLDAMFSCAAKVGIHGDQCERPVEAMVRALDGSHAGPGQCNEGFLRDDSLLVIVMLTDEYDGPGDEEPIPCQPSPGTPQQWFDTVVQARGGEEGNVVVLSLINWESAPGAGPCPPCGLAGCRIWYNTEQIERFAERFTHGFVGGICEADYGPYFEAAIDVVDTACRTYTPVG